MTGPQNKENTKVLRGKILAFLHFMAPKKVDLQAVVSIFFEYYTYEQIQKALVYLVSKEYLKEEQHPHPYKQREKVALYFITAQGIDLHEGTTSDVGIVATEM